MRRNKPLLSPGKHKSRDSQSVSFRNNGQSRLWYTRRRWAEEGRTGEKEGGGIEVWIRSGGRANTYTPRRFGLLPVYLGEHLLQQLLELLVLRPLVELADEMAPCLERVRGESQGRVAEVLFGGPMSAVCELGSHGGKQWFFFLGGGRGGEKGGQISYHATGVVLEVDPARVHQPVRVA